MELMHPAVVKIGIPVLILLLIILHAFPAFSKKKYKDGIRTGASAIVKSLPLYKRIYIRKKILTIVNEAFVIAAIVSALFLIARPYKVQSVSTGVQKRDIFLCLDVSHSMYELNYEITDYLEQVVANLDGDRIGVTIFNTSSIVYVPMTDDYDYVILRLEELKEYFNMQKELMRYIDYDWTYNDLAIIESDRCDYIYNWLRYFDAGTLVDNSTRGSSLTGEGLASCLYSFPSIGDTSRTRIILFVTDNANESMVEEIPKMDEACELCKKNDVTVFAIYPNVNHMLLQYDLYSEDIYTKAEAELRKGVEKTGGELYVQSDESTVAEIVKQIQSHEAMMVDDIVTKRMTDVPVPGIIALIISLSGVVISVAFLKGK